MMKRAQDFILIHDFDTRFAAKRHVKLANVSPGSHHQVIRDIVFIFTESDTKKITDWGI